MMIAVPQLLLSKSAEISSPRQIALENQMNLPIIISPLFFDNHRPLFTLEKYLYTNFYTIRPTFSIILFHFTFSNIVFYYLHTKWHT